MYLVVAAPPRPARGVESLEREGSTIVTLRDGDCRTQVSCAAWPTGSVRIVCHAPTGHVTMAALEGLTRACPVFMAPFAAANVRLLFLFFNRQQGGGALSFISSTRFTRSRI